MCAYVKGVEINMGVVEDCIELMKNEGYLFIYFFLCKKLVGWLVVGWLDGWLG